MSQKKSDDYGCSGGNNYTQQEPPSYGSIINETSPLVTGQEEDSTRERKRGGRTSVPSNGIPKEQRCCTDCMNDWYCAYSCMELSDMCCMCDSECFHGCMHCCVNWCNPEVWFVCTVDAMVGCLSSCCEVFSSW